MNKITLFLSVFLLFISKGYAQFPEGFEGTSFPPAGWASFTGSNGLGTTQNWKANTAAEYISSGAKSAFVRWEAGTGGVNEDWLVSPLFTVTAPNTLLSFYDTQGFDADYGTTYSIRVSSTSQTNITSFTTLDIKTEADLSVLSMSQRAVDLSAYVGQSIYIAFVMTQDDGDNWAIDDVSLLPSVTPPGCASLTFPNDGALDIQVGPILTFTWEAPTTGDIPDSYDFYAGTALPLTASDFVANSTTTSVDFTIPSFSSTFYWMVVPKNLGGKAIGCTTYSFTSESIPGYCFNAPYGQYPANTFSPSLCDGVTAEEITPDGYAGEYSLVNLTAGLTYEFSSSNPTDYITVSDADATEPLVYGLTPVTYTPTADAVVRFYTHLDDQCGDEQVIRSRFVMCSGLTISPPECVTMTYPSDNAIDIPVGQAVDFTWDPPTTGDAPDSYDFYGGTVLPLTAVDLIGNFTTNTVQLTIPTFNTTFYWMVIARNLAGEAVGCGTFTFTSQPSPGYCLNAPNGQWPSTTFVPSVCDGSIAEEIVADGYAGEYSVVTLTGGYTYEFSSGNPSDFITISADGGATAVAYGLTPVTWVPAADGDVYFYTHVDDQCGDEAIGRPRSITCFGALGIPTFNTSTIKVYPNPVKDVLNFTSTKVITTIQINNLLGQEVGAKAINKINGQADLSNLAAGTYLVKITSEDGIKTVKVIKQ
jgi:hypothetical protein